MNNKIRNILSFIFIILLLLFLLLTALNYTYKNIHIFEKFQEENNISDIVKVDKYKLKDINYALVNYLDMGRNDVLIPYFNSREISHMEDVYGLFRIKNLVYNISSILLAIILIFVYKKDNLDLFVKKSIKILNFILIGILILVIFVYFYFDESFVIFHKIFFTNDLWILDPKTDLMIRILPIEFFMLMAFNIFKIFLFLVLLVYLVSFMYLKRRCKMEGLCSIQEVK